jgi:hypothetical protein
VTLRRSGPRVDVGRGERVLAWAESSTGTLAGTRDALYLPVLVAGGWARIPWEQVEAADWDRESEVLRVVEVGTWGEARPEHAFAVTDSGRLLELLRERVTASVVLQRHVAISGTRGVRVIARRAPRGNQPPRWFFEYDEGVDPTDPDVEKAAAEALAAARDEVGEV